MLSKLFSYSWVKANLSMLLLIPTLLGGIWQILELGFIGTPYIRFFSVSQLVSDGLLISFILFWFILIFKFALVPLALQAPNDETDSEKDEKPRKYIWKRIWLVIILALQGLAIWVNLLSLEMNTPNIFKAEKVSFFELILTEINALSLIVFLLYALINLINLFKKTPNFKIRINDTNKVLKTCLYILGILFILFSFYTLPLFHKSFAITHNFGNTEQVACQLKKEHKNLKSFKILYFNDQYIFIEITEMPKKYYIEVKKFDSFFDFDCSQPSPPKNGDAKFHLKDSGT